MNLLSTSSLLLLLFTFFSQASSASINGGGGETQKLLSFKSSVSYPTGKLQNWVQNNHPCSFTGVTCNNLSHISSIDLSGNFVSSEFASVFANLLSLPYLETLYLNNCNITGTLTYKGRSLCSSVLSYVDLAENQLSGIISDLSTFKICSGLKSLNLSHNLFEFDVVGDDSLKKMMHLSDLHLLDLSHLGVFGSLC